MKLDSESTYQRSRPSEEHEAKVIVHSDSPFILAKDNHFMIDMLNIDTESQKEGKHGHKSPNERKSSNVTSPPRQYFNIEDTLDINKNYDKYVEALYSAPPSSFKMVVKEDFYTDKIVTEVELPEMRVCIEDEPCHIVRGISIDGVQPYNKSLVEIEGVSPIEFFISNQTFKNVISQKEKEQEISIESSVSNRSLDNGHLKSEIASCACADDLKYTVSDSPFIVVEKGGTDAASVLYDAIEGNSSSVGSFDNRDMLDSTVISNMSAKVTENVASPASVFHSYYDGKGSYASLIGGADNLEPINSVTSDISAEVSENNAVPGSDAHHDCGEEGCCVSSIASQNKSDTHESVVSIIYSKGSSASSITSEGNINTTKPVLGDISVEVPENRAILISDVNGDFVVKGSHVNSTYRVDKLNTDESVVSNISKNRSSVSLINSEGNKDIMKSAVTNKSAEANEKEAVTVSDLQNDCEGKGSYDSSIDGRNKLETYESVVSKVPAEVIENQLPPSQEITADSSQVNSFSRTFNADQKQSIDGQEFQDTSEETNSACPALYFPPGVPSLSNGLKEISANCKVPSGVITFCFEMEEASANGRDENREMTSNKKSEVAQNSLGTEEAAIDGPSASVRCSSLHFTQEESNLYGPALLSGHNANLGNIPYSGSISLRSESSTASTRSFAFPILQSEWNSSPVKMAKADRRRYRKHRGWRMGLLCCRF